MDERKPTSPLGVECVRIRQFDLSTQWQRSVPRRKLTFQESSPQKQEEMNRMNQVRRQRTGNGVMAVETTEHVYPKILEVTRSPKQSRLHGYQREDPRPLKYQHPLAYEIPKKDDREAGFSYICRQPVHDGNSLYHDQQSQCSVSFENAEGRDKCSTYYNWDQVQAWNHIYDQRRVNPAPNLDSDLINLVQSKHLCSRTPMINGDRFYNEITDLKHGAWPTHGTQTRSVRGADTTPAKWQSNSRSFFNTRKTDDTLNNGLSMFEIDEKMDMKRKEYSHGTETTREQGRYHSNFSKDEKHHCYERIGSENQNFRNVLRESPNMQRIVEAGKIYASPSKGFSDDNSRMNNENSSTGNLEGHYRRNNTPIRQCIVRELDSDQIKRNHTQRGDNKRSVVQFVLTGSGPNKDKEADNIITLIDESFTDYYADKGGNNKFMRKGFQNEGAIKSVNRCVGDEIEKQSRLLSIEDKGEVTGATPLTSAEVESENKQEFVGFLKGKTGVSHHENSSSSYIQKSLSPGINANSNSPQASGGGHSFEQIKKQLFFETRIKDETTIDSKTKLDLQSLSLTRTIFPERGVYQGEDAHCETQYGDAIFIVNKSFGQVVCNTDKCPEEDAVLKTPKSQQRLNRDNKSPFIRTVYQDCGQRSVSGEDANSCTSGRPVSPFSDTIITAVARCNFDRKRSEYMRLRRRDRRLRYLSEPGKFCIINSTKSSIMDMSSSNSSYGSSNSEKDSLSKLTEKEDPTSLKLTEKALKAHTMALKANSPNIRRRPTLDQFFGKIEEHVLQDSASDTSEFSTNSDSVLMIQKASKFNLTPVSGLMKDGGKFSSASSRAKRLKAWKSRHERPHKNSRPSASELISIKTTEGCEDTECFRVAGVKEVSSDGESGGSSLDCSDSLQSAEIINTDGGNIYSENKESSYMSNAPSLCSHTETVTIKSDIVSSCSNSSLDKVKNGRVGDFPAECIPLYDVDVNGNFEEINQDIFQDAKSLASEDSFEEVFVEPELLSCSPLRANVLPEENLSHVGDQIQESKSKESMHKQPDSLDVFVGSASAILERVKRLQLKYNHKTTTSCFDEKQYHKGFSVSDSIATDDLDISRGKKDHTYIEKVHNRDIANDFESKISNDVSNITRLSRNSEHLHNVPGDLLEKAANRKFTVQLDRRSSCSLEDLGSGLGKVRSPCFSSEEDLRSFRQRDANSSMNSYEISRLLKELDDVVDPEKRAKHHVVGPKNGKQLTISKGPNEEDVLNAKTLSCKKSHACEINSNGISSSRIIGHGDKKFHSNERVEQGSYGFSLGGNQELEFERKCQSVSETKLFNETTSWKTSVSDKGESCLMKDVEISEQISLEQQNGVRNGQKNTSCAVEENIRAEFYSVFDNYKEICADKAAGISSIIGENGNFESNDFINRGESRDNSILEKTKNDTAGESVNCSPLAKDGRSHFLEGEQNEQFLKNKSLVESVGKLNEELVSTCETSKIEEFLDLEREKPSAGEESENLDQPLMFLGQLVDNERYIITSVEDVFKQNSYLGESDCVLEESCSVDMAHGKGVSDLKKHFEKYQPTSNCISNEKSVSPSAPKTIEGTSMFPKKRGIGALKSMFESPNETKMNTSPASQDGSQIIGSPNLGRSEHVMRERKSKIKNNGSTVVGSETCLQRRPQDERDIKTIERKCLDEDASEKRLGQESPGINDLGFDFRSEMISDAKIKATFHESQAKPLKVPPPIKRKPSLRKTDNSAKNEEISKDNLMHAVKDQRIVVEKTTAKEGIENGGQPDDTLQVATDNFKDRNEENTGQVENQNTEARPNPEGQCLDDGKLTLPEKVEENDAFEKKDSGTDDDKELELVKEMLSLKSKKEQHVLQHSDGESSDIETKEVNSLKTEVARVCQPCQVNSCSENGVISNESCLLDQQSKNVKRGITYDPISEPLRPTDPFTNEEKQSNEADLEKSLEDGEKESETFCEAINEPITEEYNNRELSNGTAKPNARKKLLQCRSYSESSDSSFEEICPITQQTINYDNLPKLGLPKLLKEAVLPGEVSGSLENKTEDLMVKQGEQETFHEHYVSYSQKASDIKCQAAELGIYTKAAYSIAKDKTSNWKLDAKVTSIEQRSEVEAKSAKEALKKLDSRLVIIKEEASKLGIKPVLENISQTKDTTKRKSSAPITIQSTPSMSDRSGLPNVAKVSPYFHDSKSRKFIEPVQRFGANIFGDLLQEDELDGIAGEDPPKTDEQIGYSLKRNSESKEHSLEGIQKLIIGLDISSDKQKRGGIDIGVVSIDGMKTWTEVEEEAVNTFLEHLKLIDESGLDITHADIKYLTIGRHQIALGTGKDLACYSTDETQKTQRMEIKGNALSNVASLAYQSLIPKKTLEKYISLALNHRCLVFSGPSGTGKSYLANMIADTVSSRIVTNENNNNLEPIHLVNVDAERWKELKKLIDNRAEGSMPVIVVIDGFSPEFQEGIENLSLLLKESDQKNVYIIAALDQANTEDVDVKWQESMRWICFNNNEEPVCGLLIRYLRKKFLNNNPSSDWDDLFKLSKWIFSVWKQLNKIIEKFHSPEKSIGPAMFFSCPTKKDEIEEWFVDLWNYSLAPYILHVMRTGIKLFGQQEEWIDPLEIILDTYPWQQEDNIRAKIKKIRKDDVGYREALPREEGLATASTDQVRLMNFLRRLETLVENKRIVTETKPGTSQRRIYLESTL